MKATSLFIALGSMLAAAAVRTDGNIGRKPSLDARRLRRPSRGGEDEQQPRTQRMGGSHHGALVRDSMSLGPKAVKEMPLSGEEPMGDVSTPDNGHSMSVRTKTFKVKPTSDEPKEESLNQKPRDSMSVGPKAVTVMSLSDEPMGDSPTQNSGDSMSVGAKTVKVLSSGDESDSKSGAVTEDVESQTLSRRPQISEIAKLLQESFLRKDGFISSGTKSGKESGEILGDGALLEQDVDFHSTYMPSHFPTSVTSTPTPEVSLIPTPEVSLDPTAYLPTLSPTSSKSSKRGSGGEKSASTSAKAKSSKRGHHDGPDKSSKSSKTIVETHSPTLSLNYLINHLIGPPETPSPVAPKSGKGKRPGPGGDPEGKSKAKKRPSKSDKDGKSTKSSKHVKSSKRAKRTLSPVARGTEIPTFSP